jgi:outer membrane protein OmpA-like peptidoglycan-associated protein
MNRSPFLSAVVSLVLLAACAAQQPVRAPRGAWSEKYEWCDPYAYDTGSGGHPATWQCDPGSQAIVAAPAPAPAQRPAPVAAAPAPTPEPSPPASATFSPAAGTFTSAQHVALATESPGATIRYTTDGSTPTVSSTRYTGPIAVDRTTKLRALVTAKDAPPSAVSEAEYVIAPPPPVSSARVKVTEKKLELGEKVFFETSRATIKTTSYTLLDEVAQVLGANPGVRKVIVEGHTDNVGANEQNQALSEKRAAAVRDYLVNKGIAPDRLDAKGFGETRPIADNKTAAGRETNRRVEFVIP